MAAGVTTWEHGWRVTDTTLRFARPPSSTEWSPSGRNAGGSSRPEPADVLRLGRRLVRMVVATARADETPTPARLLARHLGPEASSLPVVSESWANYDHVNLQGALERWTGAPGRSTSLVGLTDFQHTMFTLADLAQSAASVHGPSIGAVAMARLASGPAGATRACVRCGLYLVSEADARLALLLREGDPRRGTEQPMVEVLCADSDRAAAMLREIRGLALAHSVFRGQILSFGVRDVRASRQPSDLS